MNLGASTGLTQDLTDITAYESSAFDVGFGDIIGIEMVCSAALTAPAKFKVKGTVSGDNYGYIKDSAGDDVILEVDETVNIFSLLNTHCQSIKIVGYADGTGTANLTAINIGH